MKRKVEEEMVAKAMKKGVGAMAREIVGANSYFWVSGQWAP